MQTTEIKLNRIICGKSEEKLKEFPDNFFDGTVTDPPYELNFMSQKWDTSGIAYNIDLWKEVLRVLKPGAYLLAFGGTRTHHRVTCAIEDAGFIIKDEIDWLYGEGFPKSTNISRQLDKEAGVEREVVGDNPNCRPNCAGKQTLSMSAPITVQPLTAPATNDAKRWNGYGTALKPAHEPIIVAMKPLENGLTYAQNAKKWDVAGLNIDGGRIGTEDNLERIQSDNKNTSTPIAPNNGWISEPQTQGRWPSNVILSHSPDCVCVGTKIINEGAPEGGYTYEGNEYQVEGFVKTCKPKAPSNRGQETIEVWACVPDCPIRMLDNQSGKMKSDGKRNGEISKNSIARSNMNSSIEGIAHIDYSDSGGASRFFYCAKAKRSEKEAGLKGFTECVKCGKFDSKTHTVVIDGEKKIEKCIRNNHPTVKPLAIMKYLLNLIKMPSAEASVNKNKNENKQVILDPFCGSGTTLVAAEQLGINYIGIDQDLDNVLISSARIGI